MPYSVDSFRTTKDLPAHERVSCSAPPPNLRPCTLKETLGQRFESARGGSLFFRLLRGKRHTRAGRSVSAASKYIKYYTNAIPHTLRASIAVVV
jgi:hypothetical protein